MLFRSLRYTANAVFTVNPKAYPQLVDQKLITICTISGQPLTISSLHLYILIGTIIIMVCLELFIKHTLTGKAMLAMIIKTRMVKCDRVTEDSAKTSSATKPCPSYSPTFISTIASGRPSAVAFNRMVPALPVFCTTAIAFP